MKILNKPVGSPFERFPQKFEEIFRQAWTNNANVCSILYSGTPALKTDFTLTGKRTIQGAIMDGVNSSKRYYINNFCDFHNQDVLDFTTMKIKTAGEVRPGGLQKFTILILSVIIGYLIIDSVSKSLLGIHSLSPEEEGYTDISYTTRFFHLVIMVAAAGAFIKTTIK